MDIATIEAAHRRSETPNGSTSAPAASANPIPHTESTVHIRHALLGGVLLAFTAVPLAAQNPQTREGFGISFGLGMGSAGASCDGCESDRTSGGAGYLRIGGYLRPNLMLAGESHGFTNSEDGIDETAGFYTFTALWHPSVESGLFIKGGIGFAADVATDGIDEMTFSAPGVVVGVGYDFRVGRNFSLTPYLNAMTSAKAEIKYNDIATGVKASMNIIQIGLGFTWH